MVLSVVAMLTWSASPDSVQAQISCLNTLNQYATSFFPQCEDLTAFKELGGGRTQDGADASKYSAASGKTLGRLHRHRDPDAQDVL